MINLVPTKCTLSLGDQFGEKPSCYIDVSLWQKADIQSCLCYVWSISGGWHMCTWEAGVAPWGSRLHLLSASVPQAAPQCEQETLSWQSSPGRWCCDVQAFCQMSQYFWKYTATRFRGKDPQWQSPHSFSLYTDLLFSFWFYALDSNEWHEPFTHGLEWRPLAAQWL